jgi:hypothetical protein
VTSKWHFRKMRPADIASDPDFAKALFSGDAARSLVRESIQNSLDARASTDQPVTVRFALRSGTRAARAADAVRFLDGMWEHIHSETSGLESAPSPRDRIPFLVVEDFGTKGLTGDPKGWDPFASGKNAFFLFFRALGRSGKKEEERGRWGVGKFVFPLASQAHCLLGYTVPIDTQAPLLMGRTVLKIHQTGGVAYHPDGQWGGRNNEDSLVVPEVSEAILREFTALFGLRRRTEPGLSVVVPWLSVALNGASIREAVVAEYFLPILRSELRVEIDDNGTFLTVDAETIASLAEGIDSPELRARISLALEAATWPDEKKLVLPAVSAWGETDWAALISEDGKTALLKALDDGRPVAIRVPLTIQPKDKPAARSYFDIFLQRREGVGHPRPLIVREGITIAADKTVAIQDHICLIIIDHGPLAALVGDSETPAHTELQPQLVANKYTLAGKIIKIIRTSAAGILRSLEQATDSDNFSLLSEFFPIVHEEQPGRRRQPAGAGTNPDPNPIPPIPKTSARYRVTPVERGFRVKGTNEGELPSTLTVRFAYDVRRGNPLKKYNPLDFSLLRRDLTVRAEGVKILDKADNTLIAQPTDQGFVIEVLGFDPLRDLVVRVDAAASEVSA